jgi:regulatory protein YycH of two-component signal transduction system YycFG
MKVVDLINVIKASVPFTYYSNGFPATASDDVAYVRLTGGGTATVQIQRPSFQVVVRAKSPATAEAKAYEVFEKLNNKRNFNVGNIHVILCQCSTSSPLYLGEDENGRHLYSINFTTISEGV